MPLGAFKAALMGTAGVSTADVVLLHDTDYSNATTAAITSGINSTYGEYIFKFYNINPATVETNFQFQGNANGQSGYNETITSTAFRTKHDEADSFTAVEYQTSTDQAEGTSYQSIGQNIGNGGDESCAGELHLFNPSSSTYVKHFISRSNNYWKDQVSGEIYAGGYFNTTTAIDDIQFKMSSGNFDGTIKLWGVK